MEFDYTDDMNQISGHGGDYERACRAAVQTGFLWVTLHPGDEPRVKGGRSSSHREGYVIGENPAGEALLKAINTQPFTMEDGRERTLGDCLTAQQYYLVLQHISLVAELGWTAYAQVMRSAEGVVLLDLNLPERLRELNS